MNSMKLFSLLLVALGCIVMVLPHAVPTGPLQIVGFNPKSLIYSYGFDDIASVDGVFDRVEILIPAIDYVDTIFYPYAHPNIWIHTTERYDANVTVTVNFQEQKGQTYPFTYETFHTQTFDAKIEPSVLEGTDVLDVVAYYDMYDVMLTKKEGYQDCWTGGQWMSLHLRSNSKARQFIAPSVKSNYQQAEGWQLNPPADMHDSKGFGTIPADYDNAACEVYVYFRFFVNTMPTSDTITCYIDCDYDSDVSWGDPDRRGFATTSFPVDFTFYENPDPPPDMHSLAIWSYWEDERIDDIVQVWVDGAVEPVLTPTTVSLVCNEPHTLVAETYIQVDNTELEFKHWKTTPETMKHSRSITVTFDDVGSSRFDLVYGIQESPEPPPKSKLTIESTPVSTLVWLDNAVLGNTTLEENLYEGVEHSIRVQKEIVISEAERYVFKEWEDGTTIENRTVSLGSDAELMAYYTTVPSAVVEQAVIGNTLYYFFGGGMILVGLLLPAIRKMSGGEW